MKCPRCSYNGSRVVDSRPADDGSTIRRRRECENCQYRFTTYERIEETPLLVVKQNGDREESNRAKILRGIHRAFEKRPFSAKEQEDIVNRIETKLREEGLREIQSAQIGEYVMEELAQIDDVAYIRFASVYRQFQDINVFMQEIQNIADTHDDPEEEAYPLLLRKMTKKVNIQSSRFVAPKRKETCAMTKYPWQAIDPKSFIQIESTNTLTMQNVHVLTKLYQPIIGGSAYSLYLTLFGETQFSAHTKGVTVSELLRKLDIGIPDFYKARIRLEGIGLLRVYRSQENNDQ